MQLLMPGIADLGRDHLGIDQSIEALLCGLKRQVERRLLSVRAIVVFHLMVGLADQRDAFVFFGEDVNVLRARQNLGVDFEGRSNHAVVAGDAIRFVRQIRRNVILKFERALAGLLKAILAHGVLAKVARQRRLSGRDGA